MSSRNRKPAKGKRIKVGNRPWFIRVKNDIIYFTDWKDRTRQEMLKPFMDHKGKLKFQKIYDHISAHF